MKNLNRILAFALLFTAFISCEKSNNSSSIIKDGEITMQSADITNRIEYSNQPLFNAEYDLAYNNISSKSASAEGTSEFLTLLERGEMFVHIADVDAPVRSDDRTLSATQVCLNNNYAYVSYHYNESNDAPMSKDLYEGQVEILDVTDPTTPIIKSAAMTDVADFNTMCFDVNSTDAQQKLWIGATDYNVGGVVYELNLSNNELNDGETLIRHKATGSYSVNVLLPILTVSPLVVKVAIKLFTDAPYGSVTEIFCPMIVPAIPFKENAVSALKSVRDAVIPYIKIALALVNAPVVYRYLKFGVIPISSTPEPVITVGDVRGNRTPLSLILYIDILLVL